jgi:hypothetical protein
MNRIEFEKETKWQPKEIIDLGDGCKIGIKASDGCYTIFLLNCSGSWEPTNWIPAGAAKRLGELAAIQISTGISFS